MNTRHSSHSEQCNVSTCPSSTSNDSKGILTVITPSFKAFASYIWDILFTPASTELRIWQKRDRLGQIHWHVYDPITDRSARFSCEQEVRRWIERQFYNR